MSLDSEIIADLPWSHHHLALASGFTDTDLTGNGRDLILQNTGTPWFYQDDALPNGDLALGKHATNALYFTAPGLARAANTVECWFKLFGSTLGGMDGTIMSGGPPVRIVVNQSTFALNLVTNAGTTAFSPTIFADNSAFHHLVITNDGAGTFQVSYDGALVYSASGISEGAIDGDSFFAGIPGFGFYCPGKWAQIAQYDYVLAGSRILAHFTAGSTSSTPAGTASITTGSTRTVLVTASAGLLPGITHPGAPLHSVAMGPLAGTCEMHRPLVQRVSLPSGYREGKT